MKVITYRCNICRTEIEELRHELERDIHLCESCADEVRKKIFTAAQPVGLQTLSVYQTHQLIHSLFKSDLRRFYMDELTALRRTENAKKEGSEEDSEKEDDQEDC